MEICLSRKNTVGHGDDLQIIRKKVEILLAGSLKLKIDKIE
jgi:hypothetical protein